MKNRLGKKYKFAVIAGDIAIFTVKMGKLQVLLIKMKKAPFTGYWALPGGLIKPQESVDAAAARLLKEKAGIENVYLEQLYTFGRVDRDPFGRVVSVAYFALIPSDGVRLATTAEYEDVAWFPIMSLPKLAYDHKEIILHAFDRLKSKLSYTNIVFGLLGKEFSLPEMQHVYEVILGHKLDKRNFRKKIQSLHLIKKTGGKQYGGASRPAALYTFIDKTPKVVEML